MTLSFSLGVCSGGGLSELLSELVSQIRAPDEGGGWGEDEGEGGVAEHKHGVGGDEDD